MPELMTEGLEEDMPRTVAVLVFNEADGTVLGVSRKDDPGLFSLPGGKVDDGETDEQAAKRELEEETGLSIKNLAIVHEGLCGDSYCTTYEGDVEGEIGTDEAGVVKWCRPSEIAYGAFGDYNQEVFDKAGILY